MTRTCWLRGRLARRGVFLRTLCLTSRARGTRFTHFSWFAASYCRGYALSRCDARDGFGRATPFEPCRPPLPHLQLRARLAPRAWCDWQNLRLVSPSHYRPITLPKRLPRLPAPAYGLPTLPNPPPPCLTARFTFPNPPHHDPIPLATLLLPRYRRWRCLNTPANGLGVTQLDRKASPLLVLW